MTVTFHLPLKLGLSHWCYFYSAVIVKEASAVNVMYRQILLLFFLNNFFNFFLKYKLVSSTQQLILLTLFIIRPVSSDQTDFIRDSNKIS